MIRNDLYGTIGSNYYKMIKLAIISVQLYRNYKTMYSNLNRNVNKIGTRRAAHYKQLWMRPGAYYKLLKSKIMNNQVGDNNY